MKNCTTCERLGKDCPKKLLLLPLDELIDWLQHLMGKHKITHETMARISGVPKGTIDRVMAKQSADCRYSTMHAMVRGLFGALGLSSDCAGEDAAAVARPDEVMQLRHDLDTSERERQALRERVEEFTARHDFMRSQIAAKDAQITEQGRTIQSQRRTIVLLVCVVIALLLLIISALVIDKTTPGVGFIWM
jgi:hypothetical protein